MNSKINDDFFEGSSMSFGDHLEELRTCLFKAIICLAIGVAIGLYYGDWVVRQIEAPIKDALVRYYQQKSILRLEENLGITLTKDQRTEVLKELKEKGWAPVDIWVEPNEIKRLANYTPPKEGDKAAEEEAKPKPEAEAKTESKADEPSTDKALDVRLALQQAQVLPVDEPIRLRTWQRIEPSTESLQVQETFMIWMKAGIVYGAILASPGIFWYLWQFVAAGLYPHEKRYVWIFVPFSLALFFGGAFLAYFLAFEPVLDFLFSFNLMTGIDPRPRISEWLGFAIMLPLGFGISFQLPLVMLLLNRIGIFSVEAYTANWRVSVLVIFFLSMILTPSDPISMLLLAVPLTFLYFMGIGLCKWMPSTRAPFPAAK